MKTLVVMPTYDEAASLEKVVTRLRRACPEADLLIVDDNSPDGTGQIADAMASKDSGINVLHRTGKEGLGPAYIAGFRWGLDHGYEVLVEMDADGSHQPEHLPRLLESAYAGADLTIGSRWVEGGGIENWPLSRQLISRGGTFYARLMLGLPVRDATAGFRAFRSSAVPALDLDTIASHGYCFQIDMTRRAHNAGLSIREVPITFVERVDGYSKMSSGIVREALWRVTVWGVRKRLGLGPTKMERAAGSASIQPPQRG